MWDARRGGGVIATLLSCKPAMICKLRFALLSSSRCHYEKHCNNNTGRNKAGNTTTLKIRDRHSCSHTPSVCSKPTLAKTKGKEQEVHKHALLTPDNHHSESTSSSPKLNISSYCKQGCIYIQLYLENNIKASS